MSGLVRVDPRAAQPRRLGRHRAEQARRQGRLRRREAARVRRPEPRAGCRALRRRAAAADPGRRPEDGRAPAGAGDRDDRRASAPSGRRPGRAASARATVAALHDRSHFRDDSPVARGEAKSRSVETTFDHDIADLGRLEQILAEQSRRLARDAARARHRRPHDRDQGPARRLDHGHPRAHRRGADQRPRGDRRHRSRPAARLRAAAPGAAARGPGGRVRRRAAQPRAARGAQPASGLPRECAAACRRLRRERTGRRAPSTAAIRTLQARSRSSRASKIAAPTRPAIGSRKPPTSAAIAMFRSRRSSGHPRAHQREVTTFLRV